VLVGSLVGWLVGDHLLLRDFGPYGIIFMTVFRILDFSVILDGHLIVASYLFTSAHFLMHLRMLPKHRLSCYVFGLLTYVLVRIS
jgi:hypothetical protein